MNGDNPVLARIEEGHVGTKWVPNPKLGQPDEQPEVAEQCSGCLHPWPCPAIRRARIDNRAQVSA